MKPHHRAYALAGAWFVIDQVTKLIAAKTLDDGYVLVIPHFMRFTLSHNRGALFGLFHDLPDTLRLGLLTGLPIAAIIGITYFLTRIPKHEVFARTGLALILGGAVGNVLDRIIFGYVIDFIDVYAGFEPLLSLTVDWFGTNRWPTFNLADCGLVVGASLLLVEVFRKPPAEEGAEAPPAGDQRASLPD